MDHILGDIHETTTPKRNISLIKSKSQLKNTTSPSYLPKLRNPFEAVLRERLHTHFLSPSVFTKKRSSNIKIVNENFKWDIEELSHLKPADIDETSTSQFDTFDLDPALESATQSRIERFFSMQEIVPSPMEPCKGEPLLKDGSPCSVGERIEVLDTYSQTTLTLPPILPKELETLLMPYFNFTQDQRFQQSEDSANEDDHGKTEDLLYKQLFVEYNDTERKNEDNSSPVRQINIEFSPIKSPYFGHLKNTPGNMEAMKNCEISPIQDGEQEQMVLSQVEHSSQMQMSIDGSFTVPNNNTSLEKQNASFDLVSSTYSTPSEKLDTSQQWDMEYSSMPSSPISSNINKLKLMRSRSFQAQKKKLSDSFDNFMNSDDETDTFEASQKTNKSDSDCGYQTGVSCEYTQTVTEESWTNSKVISSTPTKQKVF